MPHNAALTNAPQWLPIESAPSDGTRVLIFSNGAVLSAFFDTDYDGWRVGREYYFYYPTHWMPLPAAPKEDER